MMVRSLPDSARSLLAGRLVALPYTAKCPLVIRAATRPRPHHPPTHYPLLQLGAARRWTDGDLSGPTPCWAIDERQAETPYTLAADGFTSEPRDQTASSQTLS